jgi:hypothetical protein
MALSLESASLVQQKAYATINGTLESAQSRIAWEAARSFFQYWAQSGNADLQVLPFATTDVVPATGYSPIGVASQLYFVFAKNPGAGDGTDSYLSVHDAADDADPDTVHVMVRIEDDNDVQFAVNPKGWDLATDLTIHASTTAGDSTDSAAANAADGFMIVGAAA